MKNSRSATRLLVVMILQLGALLASAQAQVGPAWWYQGDDPAIDPTAPSNAKAVANVGQGKWMALKALDALSAVSSSAAQAVRDDLLKSSEQDLQGIFYPSLPGTITDEWRDKQKAPLQLGVLKALAYPFYVKANEADQDALEAKLQENGLVSGVSYFADSNGLLFPWDPSKNAEVSLNRQAASVGQLKLVFALEFLGLPQPVSVVEAQQTFVYTERGGELSSGWISQGSPVYEDFGTSQFLITSPNDLVTYLPALAPTQTDGRWFPISQSAGAQIRSDEFMDLWWSGSIRSTALRVKKPAVAVGSGNEPFSLMQKFEHRRQARNDGALDPDNPEVVVRRLEYSFTFTPDQEYSNIRILGYPAQAILPPQANSGILYRDYLVPVQVWSDLPLE